MSEHTHCDRCGTVGEHKGDDSLTADFPGKVLLRTHSDSAISPIVQGNSRELCLSCTVDLAEFLRDDDLVEAVAPDGYEEAGDLPDTTR